MLANILVLLLILSVFYVIIAAIWRADNKAEIKSNLRWAKEYKKYVETDTYGVYEDSYERYLNKLAHSRYLLIFWYRWPLYFLMRKDTTVAEADAFLNEVAEERLLKQIDNLSAELDKKKEKDAKAAEAKAKLDLLKKEMSA